MNTFFGVCTAVVRGGGKPGARPGNAYMGGEKGEGHTSSTVEPPTCSDENMQDIRTAIS